MFGENLAALSSRPRKKFRDTRNIVVSPILDIAKHYIYQFHYETTRFSFDYRLLDRDTDSRLCRIILKISTVNWRRALYSDKNERVFLKFNDHFAGDYVKSLYAWSQSCRALLPLVSILRLMIQKKN